ncbi:MAG: hypothetical protein HC884_13375 [Chloroflexaceae bacterium]|nr:hypothetical protein [Chloroflexaceae bacterium]
MKTAGLSHGVLRLLRSGMFPAPLIGAAISAIIVIIVMVMIGIAPTAPPPVAASEPFEQAVQPTRAAPGSVFAFFATGFAEETWVSLWVNAPPACVQARGSAEACVYLAGEIRSNHQGRADWTWVSPSDGAYGRWTMVARDRSGIERVISFELGPPETFPLQETPAGQREGDIAISPAAGAPGTSFALFASGYHGVEKVTFWGYPPTGPMRYLGSFGSNEHGRVDWTWESPDDAMPGRWAIRARGETSHVERIIYVEIIPDTAFPEEAHPRDPYDIAVSSARSTPGSWLSFFAGNLSAWERVEQWIVAPDGEEFQRREMVAGQNGRIDVEWEVPERAIPGTWAWVVQGTAGNTRRITFEIVHETTGQTDQPGQPEARAGERAVSPAEGRPGTTFAFFASGFQRKEAVDYRCVDPTGATIYRASTRANLAGRADWECATPPNAIPGTWATVIIGRKSHIQHELSFTVRQEGESGP